MSFRRSTAIATAATKFIAPPRPDARIVSGAVWNKEAALRAVSFMGHSLPHVIFS